MVEICEETYLLLPSPALTARMVTYHLPHRAATILCGDVSVIPSVRVLRARVVMVPFGSESKFEGKTEPNQRSRSEFGDLHFLDLAKLFGQTMTKR